MKSPYGRERKQVAARSIVLMLLFAGCTLAATPSHGAGKQDGSPSLPADIAGLVDDTALERVGVIFTYVRPF